MNSNGINRDKLHPAECCPKMHNCEKVDFINTLSPEGA